MSSCLKGNDEWDYGSAAVVPQYLSGSKKYPPRCVSGIVHHKVDNVD
jgi:hypothetical protein